MKECVHCVIKELYVTNSMFSLNAPFLQMSAKPHLNWFPEMKILFIFTIIIDSGCGDWLRIRGSDVGNQPSSVVDNATYPGSRAFQASWSDGNANLWMFGGYGFAAEVSDRPHHLNDLWLFNSTMNEWCLLHSGATATNKNPLEYGRNNENVRFVPKPRVGASACGVTDMLFVIFGGHNSDGVSQHDTWLYDIQFSKTWIPLHIKKEENVSDPPARSHASTWCLSDRMLVYGGTAENGELLSDLWEFSFRHLEWVLKTQNSHNTKSKLEVTPEPRAGATTWAVKTELYMCGGSRISITSDLIGQESAQLFSDLWLLDSTTLTWKVLYSSTSSHLNESMPSARIYSNAWVKHHDLFILGGYGNVLKKGELSILNDLWMYDTLALKWYSMPLINSGKFTAKTNEVTIRYEVPTKRCGSSVWTTERILYFFGGFGEDKLHQTVFINELIISSNYTNDLMPYISLIETHTQQMLRELSPKMIFLICLSSFSSIGLIFCAILFLKKMIEYQPRHTPTTSKHNVKYMPVEILETDLSSDLEVEM